MKTKINRISTRQWATQLFRPASNEATSLLSGRMASGWDRDSFVYPSATIVRVKIARREGNWWR